MLDIQIQPSVILSSPFVQMLLSKVINMYLRLILCKGPKNPLITIDDSKDPISANDSSDSLKIDQFFLKILLTLKRNA
jgi:hypothetical protein